MKPRSRNLAAIAVSAMIGISLVALAIHGDLIPGSMQGRPDDAGGQGPSPFANDTVTLNTLDYAIGVVNASVLVPNPSAIGNGYKIVGVQIQLAPENDSTSNGTTWRHWILDFVISNQPFINGTTLNGALYSHAITVSEVSSPGYLNSYDDAVDFMSPPVTCMTHLNNGSSSCSTDSQTGPYKLVKIGSTYLVVDPSVPNAYFQVEGTERGFQIYAAGISYQQMINLANTVISP